MNAQLRDYFDRQFEAVLAAMPPKVHELNEEIPLVVDDYPSAEVMRRAGVRHRGSLCGLYTGVPLTKRSVEFSGMPSDVVHIYREGILNLARTRSGAIDEAELRDEIRRTILHEFGHHHGLTEADLRELGYD